MQLAASVAHNVLLSPLRNIPGPSAGLTLLWIEAIDFLGFRAAYMLQLHECYGDEVRFAPRGVSFTSAATARDIYIGIDVDIDLAAKNSGALRELFWNVKRKLVATAAASAITTATANGGD